MKEKKHLVQLILAIITFTVLLIFVVNHLHIISGFFSMFFSVLLPFLIGCGIAFVLNIPMRGIEQGIFKNEKNRLYRFRRPISMVLTYIAALLFIALVLFVVVPEVADTVGKVKELLPGFVNRAEALSPFQRYRRRLRVLNRILTRYSRFSMITAEKSCRRRFLSSRPSLEPS